MTNEKLKITGGFTKILKRNKKRKILFQKFCKQFILDLLEIKNNSPKNFLSLYNKYFVFIIVIYILIINNKNNIN